MFLQWDDIRFFLETAHAGSFNSAARRLGVNQTTVGRRVRALERRLGARLFYNNKNRLELTADGYSAFDTALKMSDIAESFSRKLKGSDARLSGEVRINMTEGLATYWLLPRLQPFQQAHPEIKINWFINDFNHELGRDVDLMIRWTRPTAPHVIVSKLGEVSYSLFAAASYVQRFGVPASVEDLKNHRLLHFNSYEQNPGLHKWNELMKAIPPLILLDNTAATEAVFKSGAAITLMPNYANQVEPSIVKIPIDLGICLEIWLAYHEDQRDSLRLRALITEVQRLFEMDRGKWFN
jgi:DNA-binding transcriptional LysR family regulator